MSVFTHNGAKESCLVGLHDILKKPQTPKLPKPQLLRGFVCNWHVANYWHNGTYIDAMLFEPVSHQEGIVWVEPNTSHLVSHKAAVNCCVQCLVARNPLKTAVGMQKQQQKTLPAAPGSDADRCHPAPCLRSLHISLPDSFLPHFYSSSLQPKMPKVWGWNAECLTLPVGLTRVVGTC